MVRKLSTVSGMGGMAADRFLSSLASPGTHRLQLPGTDVPGEASGRSPRNGPSRPPGLGGSVLPEVTPLLDGLPRRGVPSRENAERAGAWNPPEVSPCSVCP